MKHEALPAVRDATTDAAWRRIHAAACAPYRAASRWSYHWAQGKLGRDPAFRALLERGDFGARPARVVDIGCGQGLVAALLAACMAERPAWPAGWGTAPACGAYTGIELMAKDADRARAALSALPFTPEFVCGDMCTTPLPGADVVVILDVLHYVDHAAQQGVLERVRGALSASKGRLLLRVGDAAQQRGFKASQWVDRIVTAVRGHTAPPTWGRSVAEWTALLDGLGFCVEPVPMSRGTPFANVLLRCELR